MNYAIEFQLEESRRPRILISYLNVKCRSSNLQGSQALFSGRVFLIRFATGTKHARRNIRQSNISLYHLHFRKTLAHAETCTSGFVRPWRPTD